MTAMCFKLVRIAVTNCEVTGNLYIFSANGNPGSSQCGKPEVAPEFPFVSEKYCGFQPIYYKTKKARLLVNHNGAG